MLNENNVNEKLSTKFSYLIRPPTPCIFGCENYDGKKDNDDEFFITAGGIVHSCPNIYELNQHNIYQHRKLQSYDQLLLKHKQTTSINQYLNAYDTEFNQYLILPRFQTKLSTLSLNSTNSDIELYRQRHENGFTKRYNRIISTNLSLLPTIWKSDNCLSFIPIQSRLSCSIGDSIKRSSLYIEPIRQTFSSICI